MTTILLEQRCGTCKFLSVTPDDHACFGTCTYPLPEWLNAHIFWANGGIRILDTELIGCATWEEKLS